MNKQDRINIINNEIRLLMDLCYITENEEQFNYLENIIFNLFNEKFELLGIEVI